MDALAGPYLQVSSFTSSAFGPITAILLKLLDSGSISFSFFRSTMDSKAALIDTSWWAALCTTTSGRRSSPGYGLSKSPIINLTRRISLTRWSSVCRETLPSLIARRNGRIKSCGGVKLVRIFNPAFTTCAAISSSVGVIRCLVCRNSTASLSETTYPLNPHCWRKISVRKW